LNIRERPSSHETLGDVRYELTPPPSASLDRRRVALSFERLRKTYVSRASLFSAPRKVAAAGDVSFTLRRGETLGPVFGGRRTRCSRI